MALLDIDYYALSVCRADVLTHKPDVAAMAARVRAAASMLPELSPIPAAQ